MRATTAGADTCSHLDCFKMAFWHLPALVCENVLVRSLIIAVAGPWGHGGLTVTQFWHTRPQFSMRLLFRVNRCMLQVNIAYAAILPAAMGNAPCDIAGCTRYRTRVHSTRRAPSCHLARGDCPMLIHMRFNSCDICCTRVRCHA